MGERLGRYTLERKLAVGGMAEVFLARQSGPEGFEKVCVVKRMLPGLAGDPSFVRMFLDEARLAAQLNHPNIAQIFDFGEVSGTYYLAMEYVPGTNLRAIVKANQKRGTYLPVPVAARIVSQAALALDYAHGATTADGASLGLVHRDVSPQNILLGTAGTVKVIDFGVAKASTATHHTRTGLIKGKYAYMSPEQIRAQPLDRRSDVYALGLVLYELLASARAIQGTTDVQIMEAAIRMSFEPIERRRPDLPEGIAQVVRRALQKDRDSRYATAQDMSEALERFITQQGQVVTGADLIRLLVDVQEAPPTSARAEDSSPSPSGPSSRRMAVASGPPAATEWPESSEPTEVAGGGSRATTRAAPGQQETRLAPLPAPPNPTTTRDIPMPAMVRPIVAGIAQFLSDGQRRLVAIVGLAIAFGVAAGFWLGGRSGSDEPDPAARTRTGPADLPMPPPPAMPPQTQTPSPKPVPETGTMAFAAAPAMDVWVDGVLRGKTPLSVKLPVGAHAVVFREDRLGLNRSTTVALAAGETHKEEWRPAKGTVSIRAVPYADVFVGEKRLGLTPLDPVSLFEGHHQFRFVNKETSRSETRDVEVLPGQDTLVKVDLRAQ